jgi:NADH-quinone oxidoreductase subunit D
VGPISAEKALNYGFTGPNLRAAGVDYDVRAMNPYSSYEDFEFDIPVGTNGDTYDRFIVRNEEIWQSLRIINQALNNLPEGPYHADAPHYYLPTKPDVYKNMEALIYHFKIVMGEIDAPVGEVYHALPPALPPAVLHLLPGLPGNGRGHDALGRHCYSLVHERHRRRAGRLVFVETD